MRLFARSYLSSRVTWFSAIGPLGGTCGLSRPLSGLASRPRKYEQCNALAMLTGRPQQPVAATPPPAWKLQAARRRRNFRPSARFSSSRQHRHIATADVESNCRRRRGRLRLSPAAGDRVIEIEKRQCEAQRRRGFRVDDPAPHVFSELAALEIEHCLECADPEITIRRFRPAHGGLEPALQ